MAVTDQSTSKVSLKKVASRSIVIPNVAILKRLYKFVQKDMKKTTRFDLGWVFRRVD
jgi:hypothetical protein